MTETGWVESKIIELPSGMTLDALERIENVLNTYFRSLHFRRFLVQFCIVFMMNCLNSEASRPIMIVKRYSRKMQMRVSFLGVLNILKQPEYSDIAAVRNLMSFIEEESILRAILQKTNPSEVTAE